MYEFFWTEVYITRKPYRKYVMLRSPVYQLVIILNSGLNLFPKHCMKIFHELNV